MPAMTKAQAGCKGSSSLELDLRHALLQRLKPAIPRLMSTVGTVRFELTKTTFVWGFTIPRNNQAMPHPHHVRLNVRRPFQPLGTQ